MTKPDYILYGLSASLYTGKVRAYLLHHGIPFEERGAGHPNFTGSIVPQIGRWIVPVLVTPDGTILQDGTDIIDHFETAGDGRYSVVPEDPLIRSVAYLFELFGGEGLLRPAMHYRWNFDADNLNFLRFNFSEAFPPGLTPEQQSAMFDQASRRMRQAGAAFGVSIDSMAAIEASYAEFLMLLDRHLQQSPFLLGDQASLGDYGLMNGLFAHLARDPYPARIMKRDAPHVFSWTERMMRPPRNTHFITAASQSTDQTVPDPLKGLMRFVATDYLPELCAHIAFANQWLEDQTSALTSGPLDRMIGFSRFDWRGQSLSTAVMPYRFWMLQRLTDHVDRCTPSETTRIRELFADTGLIDLIDHRVSHRVERTAHREVWSDRH